MAPKWGPATATDEPAMSALCLRDGDLYYYKDVSENAKELTLEEKAAAEVRDWQVLGVVG